MDNKVFKYYCPHCKCRIQTTHGMKRHIEKHENGDIRVFISPYYNLSSDIEEYNKNFWDWKFDQMDVEKHKGKWFATIENQSKINRNIVIYTIWQLS
jgi:PKD repeat protein